MNHRDPDDLTADLDKWDGNLRGFLAWLREHTLALRK
jgi:hypothetical protein